MRAVCTPPRTPQRVADRLHIAQCSSKPSVLYSGARRAVQRAPLLTIYIFDGGFGLWLGGWMCLTRSDPPPSPSAQGALRDVPDP